MSLSNKNEPWTVKYRPKTVSELQGLDSVISTVVDYLKNFKRGTKPLLLTGFPGIGKTSLVYAVANDLGYEVFELNASDDRNKKMILDKLSKAMFQASLFGSKKIILLEEIDGLSSSKDRGGLSELIKMIPKSFYPIIMSANDPWGKKFSKLRSKVNLVSIKEANSRSLLKVLKKIATQEKLNVDDSVLEAIAYRNSGDFRGAINDLQVLASGSSIIKKENLIILEDRSRKLSMLQALARVLKTKNLEIALGAFDDVNEDIDEQILWLEENVPKEYVKRQDLTNALDYLAKADVFRGRIRRWQHWRFLVYINYFLTAGIALSKKEKYKKFIQYSKNSRILKIWLANQRRGRRKSICEKISDKIHLSSRKVDCNFYEYKILLKNNANLKDYFNLDLEDCALIDT